MVYDAENYATLQKWVQDFFAKNNIIGVPNPKCKRDDSFRTIDIWTITYDVSSLPLKGGTRSFVINNRYTLPPSGMNDYAENEPNLAWVKIGSSWERRTFETEDELHAILKDIFLPPTEQEKRDAELDQHIKRIKQRQMEEDEAALKAANLKYEEALNSENGELELVICQIIKAMQRAQIYNKYTIKDHSRMITAHVQSILDLELNKQPPTVKSNDQMWTSLDLLATALETLWRT
jgi:hypothetical protein